MEFLPFGLVIWVKGGQYLPKHAWKGELSTVQVEIEEWTVHSTHQTQLANKIPFVSPTLPSTHKAKREAPSLHCMTRLLITCMEILFLKLAATIFGLDE
jgi:hypothetical protein